MLSYLGLSTNIKNSLSESYPYLSILLESIKDKYQTEITRYICLTIKEI